MVTDTTTNPTVPTTRIEAQEVEAQGRVVQNNSRVRVTLVEDTGGNVTYQVLPPQYGELMSQVGPASLLADMLPNPFSKQAAKAFTFRGRSRYRAAPSLWELASYLLTRRTVPIDIMAEALTRLLNYYRLGRESANGITVTGEVSDDIVEQMFSQPPILAVGPVLYRLVPTGKIDGARGLKLVHSRITEAAKTAAKVLVEAAKQEIVQMQRLELDKIALERDKLEQEKTAARQAISIPAWAARDLIPVRVYGHALQFGIRVQPIVQKYQYTLERSGELGEAGIYSWNSKVLSGPPRYVFIWVPLTNATTGAYNYRGMMPEGGAFPHIGSSLCGNIQGLPGAVTDFRTYDKLCEGVQRFISIANLNSLLTPPSDWVSEIQATMPRLVKAILRGGTRAPTITQETLTGYDDFTPIGDEAAETFTIDRLNGIIRTPRS